MLRRPLDLIDMQVAASTSNTGDFMRKRLWVMVIFSAYMNCVLCVQYTTIENIKKSSRNLNGDGFVDLRSLSFIKFRYSNF